ncbi:MAG: 3-phosphoshikimate 1-carboxyvinyltransferase [Myxococcales bacterium]|nr:3-phosphoshikimate 1-carboxyvinyltransferase [Myxococcales bacterium]
MTAFVVQPARSCLHGTVTVPGDKSIGHRALLFSLLTQEPVRILGLGDGADNGRSAKAIAALGAQVSRQDQAVCVRGTGLAGMRAPSAALDCGNSGTTIRMLCGLLAGAPFATRLVGDESLSKRPMRRVIEPLCTMGARIDGPRDARGDVVPPLTVGPAAGPLTPIQYELPMASAQVKTALTLAALYTRGVSSLIEPGPSRDHTERMLGFLGAPVHSGVGADGRPCTTIDTLRWDGRLRGGDLEVPGDPSSAAFLVVAALLAGAQEVRIENVCINPTRTGFLDVLEAMGAAVEQQPRHGGAEPTADLVVRGAAPALKATEISGSLVVRSLDEIPILAVVAACAHGTTLVRQAEELRVKESDRIATTCAMLRAFGVSCEERPDGFAVEGSSGAPLGAGAQVDAAGDHRIAMAGAIAALRAAGPAHIGDADNVATSYPGFVDALAHLGAAIAKV